MVAAGVYFGGSGEEVARDILILKADKRCIAYK